MTCRGCVEGRHVLREHETSRVLCQHGPRLRTTNDGPCQFLATCCLKNCASGENQMILFSVQAVRSLVLWGRCGEIRIAEDSLDQNMMDVDSCSPVSGQLGRDPQQPH
jgi:hypothetical protein